MQSRPQMGFSYLPVVIKNLIIINGLFFLATLTFSDLRIYLALFFWKSVYFQPYQIVTHMFMHADFMHFFFNMLMLWFLGTRLENLWGPKKFLTFYLVTGLGAALLYTGVRGFENMQYIQHLDSFARDSALFKEALKSYYASFVNVPVLGASGAVFGVLMAFGMLFPNDKIYLYFLIPIKVKYLVTFLAIGELYAGIALRGTGIAHFAHLGGMVFGYLLIKYWESKGNKYL